MTNSSNDTLSSPYCSAFLNWDEDVQSVHENAVVFQSLIATLKSTPAFDASLEGKAVNFLESVEPNGRQSADAFLRSIASISDGSLTDFVRSIVVLVSSASQGITLSAMKIVPSLLFWSAADLKLALIEADLIPQIVKNINLQSLSFEEAEDIHINVMKSITNSLWLTTPYSLSQLEIEDDNEQQVVHKTIFEQVLVPSEKYLCHLCMNRTSIIDGDQSYEFMRLLSHLLEISPYHQPTIDFVLPMPVVLSSASCLTFFEHDASIWTFLYLLNKSQREWNAKREAVQQMGRTVHRMLRMEGIDDVIEEKLRNDRNGLRGRSIADESTQLNGLLGMNLPQRR
ncbi:hypothetical protein BLNAU_21837 [Blattamonas nauphoetae]|uniref:Uncharacterized protein n=1 Tax=Blattamonas nauphoetae TaxID=2049346 RepID=A0ABQ9WUU8_9EUKA|nr:hypothetical protein BLNAU_21837 [Blattamonas nauphoetae]